MAFGEGNWTDLLLEGKWQTASSSWVQETYPSLLLRPQGSREDYKRNARELLPPRVLWLALSLNSSVLHSAALPLLSSFPVFLQRDIISCLFSLFILFIFHCTFFFYSAVIKTEGHYIKSHMLSHLFFMLCWCNESWAKHKRVVGRSG